MNVESLLCANVLKYYTPLPDSEVKDVSPFSLLTPERLDLMARYVLIRQLDQQVGIGWGIEVYRNLLHSWNKNFIDGDGRKTSFFDYLKNLMILMDSIRDNGFDARYGAIPYTERTIVDGAHRLAVCLYYNKNVCAVPVAGEPHVQDAATLLRIGMNSVVVENLVHEYIKLDKSCRVAVLFPYVKEASPRSFKVINERVKVIHYKDLYLSDKGKKNLIALLYGHENWWDDCHFQRFIDLRFRANEPVRLVYIRPAVGQDLRQVKESVRDLYGAENGAIHINDTHDESVWIADASLNPNGLHHLNFSTPPSPHFFDKIESYKKSLNAKPHLADKVCIDSSAVMDLYGLRAARDIDYISAVNELIVPDSDEIGCHNTEYQDFLFPVDEMIVNPNHYFSYKGIKFMSLSRVYEFKKWRAAKKDIKDITLIKDVSESMVQLSAARNILNIIIGRIKQVSLMSHDYLVGIAKKILPNFLYQPLKRIYLSLFAKDDC